MIPKGIIIEWVGTVDEIPNGFAPCNGENGTVDLRDYSKGKKVAYTTRWYLQKLEDPTVRETYNMLHSVMKYKAMFQFDYSLDKANRIATRYAVKNTWKEFNK